MITVQKKPVTEASEQLRNWIPKIEETKCKGAADPVQANELLQPEDGVEVKVEKGGRFLFPVSFSLFEQYIDSENLITYLVHKTKDASQHEVMLANKAVCHKLLRKFYNSFYMFPKRRKLKKCNFKEIPAELKTQLLKAGKPLDELAAKTLANYRHAVSAGEITQVAYPSNSISPIVSFSVFEKHIKNIFDIAWSLMLNEPNFAKKSYEDCAHAYYMAFYLTPNIRDRYPYILVPCTAAMRDRILAIPNKDEAQALQLHNQSHTFPKSLEPDLQFNVAAIESDERLFLDKTVKTTQTQTDKLPQIALPVSNKS